MKKTIVFLLLFSIFFGSLTACQKDPDAYTTVNGVTVKRQSTSQVSEATVEQEKETESFQAVYEQSLKNYKLDLYGKMHQIHIDAEVDLPKIRIADLHILHIKPHFVEKIFQNVLTYFLQRDEYQEEQVNPRHPVDPYIKNYVNKEKHKSLSVNYSLHTETIRANISSYKQLNPFSEAVSESLDAMKPILSSQMAQQTCEEFLRFCGIEGFKFQYILAFNNGKSAPYYFIVYTPEIDRLYTQPLLDHESGSISFKIDSEGIQEVSLGLYEITKQKGLQHFLSLEDAIKKLEENIDLIFLEKEAVIHALQKSKENKVHEEITDFQVNKIRLEYILELPNQYSGENKVSLVWRFYLTKPEGQSDYETILAIRVSDGTLVVKNLSNRV